MNAQTAAPTPAAAVNSIRRLALIGNDGRRFTLKPLPGPRRPAATGKERRARRLELVS
jgi:hypothetical protein